MKESLKNMFLLNGKVTDMKVWGLIWLINIALFSAFCKAKAIAIIPSPQAILAAYPKLITEDNLFGELFASATLYLTVMLLSTVMAFAISYSSRVPILKPVSISTSKLRGSTAVGMFALFITVAPDGYWLKVWLMVFGVAPWMITAMNQIVGSIKTERYELGRSLKLSRWKLNWHVVVRGTLREAVDAFRQVAIMGIVLLPYSEGVARANGGIGLLLINLERAKMFDKIWAVQILLVCVVTFIDFMLRSLVQCMPAPAEED